MAVCNFHSAIAGFLKTHPIEDLVPHLVEAVGFNDLRQEIENFNWESRKPGAVYCWRCGKKQKKLLTAQEGRPYGSTTAFETVVVGYTCDECGHTEDL
jgi:hypothetical protein